MVDRTPEAAVEAFLEPLRQAALCLTDRPLLASGYRPSAAPHSVTFAPRGDAVPLRSRSGFRGVDLFVSHRYRIVEAAGADRGAWKAATAAYTYDILDRSGRELLTYHWHPDDAGPDFPHLHVSGRIGALPIGENQPPIALGTMHLPTGLVSFAAVVRLLIDEFAVAPRRDDWRNLIAASEAAFNA